MFFWKIVTRKGVDFGTNGVFRRNFQEWNGSNIHNCIHVDACQRERKVMWPLLYTCTLLRFNKSCRPLNADNQTACHLRIKSSTVSSFLHSKNPSDPCHHLSMILLQINSYSKSWDYESWDSSCEKSWVLPAQNQWVPVKVKPSPKLIRLAYGVYLTRQLIWRQTESSVLQNTEIKYSPSILKHNKG